ncbi:hypothetical protein ACP4OV_000243 [Aristida adscensionis]
MRAAAPRTSSHTPLPLPAAQPVEDASDGGQENNDGSSDDDNAAMHPPGMELDFLGLRSPPPPTAGGHGGAAMPRWAHELTPPFAARRGGDDALRLAAPAPIPPPPARPHGIAVDPDVPAAGANQMFPSAAPSGTLTIFYGGSVHLFDNVPREKAEQIMSLAATEPRAVASPAVRQPEPAAFPKTTQMMTLWAQAQAQAQARADVPLARNASLARFLERRRQRVANAAMDAFPIVSARNEHSFGSMEQQPWASGSPNNMSGNYDDDALDTKLKI